MSRGFGTHQRLILRALADQPCVYLRDLLHAPTKAEHNALSRAACRLHAMGLIGMHGYHCGNRKTLLTRLGFVIGKRPPLSVG